MTLPVNYTAKTYTRANIGYRQFVWIERSEQIYFLTNIEQETCDHDFVSIKDHANKYICSKCGLNLKRQHGWLNFRSDGFVSKGGLKSLQDEITLIKEIIEHQKNNPN